MKVNKLPPLPLCDECEPLGYCKERCKNIKPKVELCTDCTELGYCWDVEMQKLGILDYSKPVCGLIEPF